MKNGADKIEALIAAQKPGYSLDQKFYTDPDIYERELRHIIRRNWYVAGHVSELPNAGDFKVFRVADESAIVVRSNDGTINGFANVCRHRGSLVCLESSGHTRKFSCPYHGWAYDVDGNLTAARNMPEDFDKSAHSLHRVSLEVVHGLILVCFSDKPP
ncbi:MAG: aromatic ring-hydroxylating dioxygenase subunit alpha, partial [Woeseiaceae bacterium]